MSDATDADSEDVDVAGTLGPANLADQVASAAARRPDADAVVEPATQRRLTWAQLDQRIDAVAAGLASSGLRAGHRLGLQGPNSIDFVVAYLAAVRLGLVAVPVDPRASADDVRQLLSVCRVRALLGGSAPDGWDGRRWELSEAGLDPLADQGHSPVVSPPDAEALAALLTTAGTSGDPKVVMLTHRALLGPAVRADTARLIGPDETVLGLLPFCHVFGLAAVLGTWLSGGARLVVADADAVDLFGVIQAEGVTHLPVTPTLLYRLSSDDRGIDAIASVRTVISGAAPLPWRLARSFSARTGLRVEQGYGLTEAPLGVAATLGGPILGPTHVGRPLPGVEVRIGDGSDPGEPAEIAIRGDNLFSGYWPDAVGGPDADGWFGTDDIGYLRDGELFLIDRARELVVVNGFTVYPTEVEETIRELPEVRAVAVVGRAHERTGHQLVAFAAGPELTEEQVLRHCASRLAVFKRPAEVRLVEDLPRGVTGKVRRAELRQLLESETGS